MIRVRLEWIDRNGDTHREPRPIAWPADVPLPRPGDSVAMERHGARWSVPVEGIRWELQEEGGGLAPWAAVILGDLGAY